MGGRAATVDDMLSEPKQDIAVGTVAYAEIAGCGPLIRNRSLWMVGLESQDLWA